jgi:UbiA prenyltransferase family
VSHVATLKHWGALLRLSLLPSALADVAAGLVLAGSDPFRWSALPAFLASLCIFHGGLALNDWRDRDADAALRPGRPLVSGAIKPAAALAAGLLGLSLGPHSATYGSAAAAWVWLGVAVCAALYDLWPVARRSSPLWLGLCRAGNLLAAALYGQGLRISAQAHRTPAGNTGSPVELAGDNPGLGLMDLLSGHSPWPQAALLAALGYGLYVAALSFLAQLEDDQRRVPGSRPRPRLLLAALLLGLLPLPVLLAGLERDFGADSSPAWLVPAPEQLAASALGMLLALGAAGGLVRAAHARAVWTHAEVSADVGRCLRRLLIATSAVCLVSANPMGLPVGLLILLGYPLAHGLRRVFPPS